MKTSGEKIMFANILSQYWWLILLRGVISVLFGIAVFMQPGISLLVLTLFFGAFVLVDGIGNIVTAVGGRKTHEHWWVLLLIGLCGVGIGALTFYSPGLTALALLFYIAIWAIATGLLAIVAAIRVRKEIEGEFWLILAGLASVAFGVLAVARPGAGALSILWLIAGYALAFGIILIVFSFRARGFAKRLPAATKA
jgi:uncharacterized membrane protein HdeD (DUF308 family)